MSKGRRRCSSSRRESGNSPFLCLFVLFRLISSRKALNNTPAIWASLSLVKLTHEISYHTHKAKHIYYLAFDSFLSPNSAKTVSLCLLASHLIFHPVENG